MLTQRDVEDITIMRNLQETAEINAETREMKSLMQQNNRLSVALQEKNNQIQKLRDQLTYANNACTARNEIIRTDKLVQKHLVQEIAKANKQPETEVKEYTKKLRRKAFDYYVDEALTNGTLNEDPRKNELADWYAALL